MIDDTLVESIFGYRCVPVDLSAEVLPSLEALFEPGLVRDDIYAGEPIEPEMLMSAGDVRRIERLQALPEFPRVCLVSTDEAKVIQIQRDGFFYNHRRTETQAVPDFQRVRDGFYDALGRYLDWVENCGLLSADPVLYELTMIHHIEKQHGLLSREGVSRFFPDFRWRETEEGPLKAKGHNWQLLYQLNQNGSVSASITSGRTKAGEPMVLFELTAREGLYDTSQDAMRKWYDTANEAIDKCGQHLLSPDLREVA